MGGWAEKGVARVVLRRLGDGIGSCYFTIFLVSDNSLRDLLRAVNVMNSWCCLMLVQFFFARVVSCKIRSRTGNLLQNSKETVGLCKKLRINWPRTATEKSSFI